MGNLIGMEWMSFSLNNVSTLLVQFIKIRDLAAYIIRASLAKHQRVNDKNMKEYEYEEYEISGM